MPFIVPEGIYALHRCEVEPTPANTPELLSSLGASAAIFCYGDTLFHALKTEESTTIEVMIETDTNKAALDQLKAGFTPDNKMADYAQLKLIAEITHRSWNITSDGVFKEILAWLDSMYRPYENENTHLFNEINQEAWEKGTNFVLYLDWLRANYLAIGAQIDAACKQAPEAPVNLPYNQGINLCVPAGIRGFEFMSEIQKAIKSLKEGVRSELSYPLHFKLPSPFQSLSDQYSFQQIIKLSPDNLAEILRSHSSTYFYKARVRIPLLESQKNTLLGDIKDRGKLPEKTHLKLLIQDIQAREPNYKLGAQSPWIDEQLQEELKKESTHNTLVYGLWVMPRQIIGIESSLMEAALQMNIPVFTLLLTAAKTDTINKVFTTKILKDTPAEIHGDGVDFFGRGELFSNLTLTTLITNINNTENNYYREEDKKSQTLIPLEILRRAVMHANESTIKQTIDLLYPEKKYHHRILHLSNQMSPQVQSEIVIKLILLRNRDEFTDLLKNVAQSLWSLYKQLDAAALLLIMNHEMKRYKVPVSLRWFLTYNSLITQEDYCNFIRKMTPELIDAAIQTQSTDSYDSYITFRYIARRHEQEVTYLILDKASPKALTQLFIGARYCHYDLSSICPTTGSISLFILLLSKLEKHTNQLLSCKIGDSSQTLLEFISQPEGYGIAFTGGHDYKAIVNPSHRLYLLYCDPAQSALNKPLIRQCLSYLDKEQKHPEALMALAMIAADEDSDDLREIYIAALEKKAPSKSTPKLFQPKYSSAQALLDANPALLDPKDGSRGVEMFITTFKSKIARPAEKAPAVSAEDFAL